jgi:hypothetical protein
VRLAYFQANRLLTGLDKTETEIRWRKDDNKIKKRTDIDRHDLKPSSNSRQPPNPPPFSLLTTFKRILYTVHCFFTQKLDIHYSVFQGQRRFIVGYSSTTKQKDWERGWGQLYLIFIWEGEILPGWMVLLSLTALLNKGQLLSTCLFQIAHQSLSANLCGITTSHLSFLTSLLFSLYQWGCLCQCQQMLSKSMSA